MANPLKQKATDDADGWIGQRPGMTVEDLHQFCANANASRLAKRMGWWYFVRRGEDEKFFVDKLEGWRAEEARARAAGAPIEWYRADPEDAKACHDFARRMMDQGMTQYEFNRFVQRNGGAKRVAAKGELV